jgi:hypothetical protein
MAMLARRSLSQVTLDAMASIADEVALDIERKRAEEELIRFNRAAVGRELRMLELTAGHDQCRPNPASL